MQPHRHMIFGDAQHLAHRPVAQAIEQHQGQRGIQLRQLADGLVKLPQAYILLLRYRAVGRIPR